MITESDITQEMHYLNKAAKKDNRVYWHKKGSGGQWGLFEVHNENIYRLVYVSDNNVGFFAYVNLLKNIFENEKSQK